MTSVAKVMTGAEPIPIIKLPEVNHFFLNEFSSTIVDCLAPWNTAIGRLADHYHWGFFDRPSLSVLVLPFSFYPSPEERQLKRDMDELAVYADMRGSRQAIEPSYNASLLNSTLSSYLVAFSNAQCRIQTNYRSLIVPLVSLLDQWMNRPEYERTELLLLVLERNGLRLPKNGNKIALFRDIISLINILELSLQEHVALYLLAKDIREARVHPQEVDFEPPIPLDQFFNKA
ncbi:MAG TPA: hypothetical protein VLG44_08645 [Chlamydiales bacterium]|nr:hypothetical protein [Chlamydiales bacterium]